MNKLNRIVAWFTSGWLLLWGVLGMFASTLTWAKFSFACEIYLAVWTVVTLTRKRA